LEKQLRSAGLRVTVAKSALHAVETWNGLAAANDLPHLILLDHDLPDHDGVWLAQQLRSIAAARLPPIILLTSLGDLVRGQAIAGGLTLVLTKPVKRDTLMDALATALGRKSSGDAPLKPRLGSEPSLNLRVLVAEDNIVNQKLIVRLLEKVGCAVTLAINGREALDRLRDGAIDVALMDCQMPEMDGYEATRQIRAGAAGEAYRQLPIIALTANALTGDRERCLIAGMSDYLTKPIEPKTLFALLKSYEHRSASAAPRCVAAIADSESATR
jgi:CheY-like chemotaxis protein